MNRNMLNLLVVDGNPETRFHVKRLLKTTVPPIHLLEANTLARATEVLSTTPIDCVLLALNLTGVEQLHPSLTETAAVALIDGAPTDLLLKLKLSDYVSRESLDKDTLLMAMRHAISRHQDRLLKQRVRSESRYASLGRLTASAAHEINNPNTVVFSNLSLLMEMMEEWEPFMHGLAQIAQTDPHGPTARLVAQHKELIDVEDMRDMIAESLSSLERVTRIVRQLQAVARKDSQQHDYPTNLNEVVRNVLLIAESQLPQHTRLSLELTEGLPAIMGRRSRLTKMLTHIAVNAGQALKAPNVTAPALTISTHASGDQVTLQITDNGQGIVAEALPHVFDPFFTTRPIGEGFGLGLTSAREIAMEHNGKLTIHSKVAEGTTVRVVFPQAP